MRLERQPIFHKISILCLFYTYVGILLLLKTYCDNGYLVAFFSNGFLKKIFSLQYDVPMQLQLVLVEFFFNWSFRSIFSFTIQVNET